MQIHMWDEDTQTRKKSYVEHLKVNTLSVMSNTTMGQRRDREPVPTCRQITLHTSFTSLMFQGELATTRKVVSL